MNASQTIVRTLLLAIAGYLTFVACVVAYHEFIRFRTPNHVLSIFRTEGILVALMFATTEYLKIDHGETVGFLRRLIYSFFAMLLAVICTVRIKRWFNWAGGQITDEQYYLIIGIVLLIFAIEIFMIRYACELIQKNKARRTEAKTPHPLDK